MLITALIIFFITYLIISVQKIRWLRLDRPSGVVLGAVAMVLTGVLSLDEAYRVIDFNTILLLLGMMILIAYLKIANCFKFLSYWILKHSKSPFILLCLVVFASGILSALFVNDTICLMFTPLLLVTLKQARINPVPFLIALATSSNLGSVTTLTGNPQNMLIGVFSHWPYLKFTLLMLPIGIAGLVIDIVVIYLLLRKDFHRQNIDTANIEKPIFDLKLIKKAIAVLCAMMLGFIISGNLPLVAITGGVAIIILARIRPSLAFERIDWSLLLFFCGLFVVVGGVNKVNILNKSYNLFQPFFGGTTSTQITTFSIFSVILSNIVSNVPFVMFSGQWIDKFKDPHTMWLVLAMSSTFAGNLTIVGSVANMIVMELSRDTVQISFWEFFKVGFLITCLSTLTGILILNCY